MKRILVVSAIAILLSAGGSFAQDSAEEAEESAIQAVLEDYIVGWREGDPERLSRAFASETGTIMWVGSEDGREVLQSMTFGAAVARGKSNLSYGLEWRVGSLDVVDSHVAVAKLYISRSGGSYVDFLTLYKIDGMWKIVNKAFVSRAN
jgi:hypothetical protein